jgi:7-cyano-7-deazaguanine reductase
MIPSHPLQNPVHGTVTMSYSSSRSGGGKRSAAVSDAPSGGLAVGARPAPDEPPTVPARRLDVFPNPAPQNDYLIQFQIPEFTCHCPLTGQPDFAQLSIDCIADRLCVELKSLKLYMWSYRNEGAFHEKVTNDIAADLVAAIKPRFLRVTARWNIRGGITTHVVVEHRKKGWKPQPVVALPSAG